MIFVHCAKLVWAYFVDALTSTLDKGSLPWNRCRVAELWDWRSKKMLFGLLVIPVVLYGCEVWGSNMSISRWRQIENCKYISWFSSQAISKLKPVFIEKFLDRFLYLIFELLQVAIGCGDNGFRSLLQLDGVLKPSVWGYTKWNISEDQTMLIQNRLKFLILVVSRLLFHGFCWNQAMCCPDYFIMSEDGFHPFGGNLPRAAIRHSPENHLPAIHLEWELHPFEALRVLVECLHPLNAQYDICVIQIYNKEIVSHCAISHGDAQLRNQVSAW